MLLNRNSNKKPSAYSGLMYFIFVVIIIIVVAFGAKDKIRTALKEFLYASPSNSIISKEDVEVVIYEFLKANPQVIVSSLQDMQKREYEDSLKQAKITIKTKKDELQGTNGEMVLYSGNKDGDVVVTTFLDYRCGYCKKANDALEQLVKKDPNVKVVYKEYPVLGELSVKLAKTAIAVYLVDPTKYAEFHNALMGSREANDKFVQDTLKSLNINHIKVKDLMEDARVQKELAAVAELSKEIGVRGTPAFVVGDELIPGAIDFNSMVELVKVTRGKQQAKK